MKVENQAHVDDWVGVYALEALTAAERRVVENHLAVCAHCRALARAARQSADALAQSVEPVAPSPELKRKLFAHIDADLARAKPQPNLFARMFATRARGFAFATVFVILLLGIWISVSIRTADLPAAQAAPAGAQAQLVMVPSLPTGMLVVSGLKQLGPDQTYELWLIREGEMSRAGIFNVDAHGYGWYIIRYDEPIGNFQKAGVTIERAGGSDVPNPNGLVFAGVIR